MPQNIVFNTLIYIIFNLLFAILNEFPRADRGGYKLFLWGWKILSILVLEKSPLSRWHLFIRRIIHFLKLSNIFKINACNVRSVLGVLDPLQSCRPNHISIVEIIIPFLSCDSCLWVDSFHVVILVHHIILYIFSIKSLALSAFNVSHIQRVSNELSRLIIRISYSSIEKLLMTSLDEWPISVSY